MKQQKKIFRKFRNKKNGTNKKLTRKEREILERLKHEQREYEMYIKEFGDIAFGFH